MCPDRGRSVHDQFTIARPRKFQPGLSARPKRPQALRTRGLIV
ncbi:protein of unknown function [Methylocella tundrae]|uniref:Uncharacterized protein n=1 Tax=Methylocella tundrae TaxID=227605 RepID=A0A4U8Z5G9_METTU|nr:protein of unknown function [Methylocella tundrae]